MKFSSTKLIIPKVIDLEPRYDERGFFVRNFAIEEFEKETRIPFQIVHINRSLTKQKGTIRGFHFQKKPFEEGKIFQCLRGALFDAVVDMRRDSATYGQWISVELREGDNKMIYIPKGFANAIQTLADTTEIQYFVSQRYAPEHESGVRWDDPFLNIPWPIVPPTFISEKDKQWPYLEFP